MVGPDLEGSRLNGGDFASETTPAIPFEAVHYSAKNSADGKAVNLCYVLTLKFTLE
jgi:hypothetical protein